jgi:hypothetical protein
MKSTTGAYGDFPEYYYDDGNLFGDYLLGRKPRVSTADQKEFELLGGGGPVIRPRKEPCNRNGTARASSPRSELLAYIKDTIRPKDAREVFLSLARVKGLTVPSRSAGDPYDDLDEFVLAVLTPDEQCVVLVRLKQAHKETRERRRLQAQRNRRASAKSSRRKNPKGRRTPQRSSLQWGRHGRGKCAACGAALSEADQVESLASKALLSGLAYCSDDIAKLRARFGSA